MVEQNIFPNFGQNQSENLKIKIWKLHLASISNKREQN